MTAKYECIIHACIAGQVQGVGYRAWAESEAVARGLSGWVRNRSDGAVEAVFAGSADAVAAMAESLNRGPHAANPRGLQIRQGTERDLEPAFGAGFVILP